jgi:hypothetical protein
MISYERKLDIDNKLNSYLKITGILNNVFRPQNPLRKQKYNYTIHWPSQCCYMAVKLGLLKQGMLEEYQQRRSRINLDRLQNKYTNCKGVKNNSNFGQITGIQVKLDTACKQNAS